MNEIRTVVGTSNPEFNSVTLYGVDFLKSGQVDQSGRFYLKRGVGREQIQYALVRGRTANEVAQNVSGEVILNDVVHLERKEVLSNGSLIVGERFSGEELTVAVRVLEEEAAAQTTEKQQTAES